uniref:Uncharacterized protein n=1 Tax=Molossus molossus TaxID=27622 RepID=A0A7J8FYL3_MOLMO|nr:hypothetical protein HJG59_008154 [Molossus molossus]
MNCARMNSIYIKYTYIALYLGRALSLFSLSHFKNEVLLPLSVVQPSSSQLAKLCLRWLKTGNQGFWRVDRPPSRREGSPPTCPVPEAAGGEGGLFRVRVLVLFWVRLFLGRGRGVCADYSCLVRFVLLLFNIVSMPGRGSEKPLLLPK